MLAEAAGDTLQVTWDAPTDWEPNLAFRVTLSPSERVKEAGSISRDPLGCDVGESPTMAGSEPPEHAETRRTRKGTRPRRPDRNRRKEVGRWRGLISRSALRAQRALIMWLSENPGL